LAISKDGNTLFAGTTSGLLYRITNLSEVSDTLTGDIIYPQCVVKTVQLNLPAVLGRAITSISTNPSNPNVLIVTLGNYGNSNYIYYSNNIMDDNPTFTLKQGDLPAMPIYASLSEMKDSKKAFVGTEYGIYYTSDITATNVKWIPQMPNLIVPVYMLTQQTNYEEGVSNYGVIFAATHGRGIWKTADFLTTEDNRNVVNINKFSTINIFPNPVAENAHIAYTQEENADVIVRIFDIKGSVVKIVNLQNQHAGYNKIDVNCDDLKNGVYMLSIVAGKQKLNSKFIISK
jgi:hypothetical protein